MAASVTILSDQYWWISFSLHHWNAKLQHWPLGDTVVTCATIGNWKEKHLQPDVNNESKKGG
jgi:hypothetical protein